MTQLQAREGDLWLPIQPSRDMYSIASEGAILLVKRYPAGDCDTVPWPLQTANHRRRLAEVLYDAREMGYLDGDSILLPDGTILNLDSVLI